MGSVQEHWPVSTEVGTKRHRVRCLSTPARAPHLVTDIHIRFGDTRLMWRSEHRWVKTRNGTKDCHPGLFTNPGHNVLI